MYTPSSVDRIGSGAIDPSSLDLNQSNNGNNYSGSTSAPFDMYFSSHDSSQSMSGAGTAWKEWDAWASMPANVHSGQSWHFHHHQNQEGQGQGLAQPIVYGESYGVGAGLEQKRGKPSKAREPQYYSSTDILVSNSKGENSRPSTSAGRSTVSGIGVGGDASNELPFHLPSFLLNGGIGGLVTDHPGSAGYAASSSGTAIGCVSGSGSGSGAMFSTGIGKPFEFGPVDNSSADILAYGSDISTFAPTSLGAELPEFNHAYSELFDTHPKSKLYSTSLDTRSSSGDGFEVGEVDRLRNINTPTWRFKPKPSMPFDFADPKETTPPSRDHGQAEVLSQGAGIRKEVLMQTHSSGETRGRSTPASRSTQTPVHAFQQSQQIRDVEVMDEQQTMMAASPNLLTDVNIDFINANERSVMSYDRPTSITSVPFSVPLALSPPLPTPCTAVSVNTPAIKTYSQSGFDVLPLLVRIATRPHPAIAIGAVDLECAFVVADRKGRGGDTPIVYASQAFCDLTGYTASEVLGRNCRFLQAPPPPPVPHGLDGEKERDQMPGVGGSAITGGSGTGREVVRGAPRMYTSGEKAREMSTAIDEGREVQVTLLNYKKDGRSFLNRVTIVPVPGSDPVAAMTSKEEDDMGRYLVGFQVDLGDKERAGGSSLSVEGEYGVAFALVGMMKGEKEVSIAERSARAMAKEMRALVTSKEFQTSVKLSTACNALPFSATLRSTGMLALSLGSRNDELQASGGGEEAIVSSDVTISTPNARLPDPRDERQWLHLLLLENSPDFVLVLSLKGHFLYVAPSVRRELGWEQDDLVGKSVGEMCHPSDAVPVLRELKESTVAPSTSGLEERTREEDWRANAESGVGSERRGVSSLKSGPGPALVNLLFRMRRKTNGYAWVECIGRLHVEPGKGRKAIVLSGRVCAAIPSVRWGVVGKAGGMVITPATRRWEGERRRTESGECNADAVQTTEEHAEEREFWAIISTDGIFLVTSAGCRDVLGKKPSEMIGRSLKDFCCGSDENHNPASGESCASFARVRDTLSKMTENPDVVREDATTIRCWMLKHNTGRALVDIVLYLSVDGTSSIRGSQRVIAQFKCLDSTSIDHSPHLGVNSQPVASRNTRHTSRRTHTVSWSPKIPLVSRIINVASANILAEIQVHLNGEQGGTSWQYELQQLKFANDRLKAEVRKLEISLR